MTRLLPLLLLILISSGPRAESYAQRDDVQAFVEEMHTRHGFDAEILSTLFRQTRPIAAVIKAIMPPKDPGVRSWRAYRGRFVEPKRIAAGRRFMRAHAAAFAAAETRFGVPADVIAAIIGVETIYGKQVGRFGTFAALATLAFDYPPRAELFRKELEELLLLAREEDRDPLAYTGSYAGALGLPQFLPSSRRRFAIDFDHDGRIDLAASAADAIGSVANFLAVHGWERDAPIAVVVTVTGDGVQSLINEGIAPQRTPREMEAAMVSFTRVMRSGAVHAGALSDGDSPLCPAGAAPCTLGTPAGIPRDGTGNTAPDAVVESAAIPDRPAALIDLITPHATTEYRLGYRNFYVITRYNRSSFYAAAVMDLAAALRASR